MTAAVHVVCIRQLEAWQSDAYVAVLCIVAQQGMALASQV